ncbi:MAG: DUF853 family protein [Bacteroidales bacterium]|nr:DUF853 family protein [Candidatus Physcousia equi]
MYLNNSLYVAHCDQGPIHLVGKMCNRHGLIAGATGTGKTVTLQVLAETFCQAGVPCFMADMKGDLSGISQEGKLSSFIEKRCSEFGIKPDELEFAGCPVRFYDVYGEQGFPMRTTVSAMGPQLLSRLMELNETQAGVLNIVFRIADDEQFLLIDLKDLRMMLDFVGKNASKFTTRYGNVSASSVGAIQRSILAIESEGGDKFFGEPSFDINDLLDTERGLGVMSVLAADRLMMQPKLYSTFLLWMLTELYATLPEVGDQELPKLVFFFDEAHMLFDGTSKALTDKLQQVIRLIRSKGVGIYFITQSPSDIPDVILGQLGNRFQHALRAYTPKDQKAVRAAAETFRTNPAFDTEEAIKELATGEALVSILDEGGAPTMVERARILFPLSQIGAITPEQRQSIQNAAPARIKGYASFFDRESAYEVLTGAAEAAEREAEERAAAKAQEQREKEEARLAEQQAKEEARLAEKQAKEEARREAAEARQAEKEQRERERQEAAERKEAERAMKELERQQAAARKEAERLAKERQREAERHAKAQQKAAQNTLGRTIFGTVARSVTSSVSRRITNTILKSIFK